MAHYCVWNANRDWFCSRNKGVRAVTPGKQGETVSPVVDSVWGFTRTVEYGRPEGLGTYQAPRGGSAVWQTANR